MSVSAILPHHEADSGRGVLNLGVRLRHARLARGARLKDVAEAAGCSESLVSKIENNKLQPSLDVLRRLCGALGLTLGELFATPSADEDVVQRNGSRVVVDLDPVRRGEGIRLERLVPYSAGHLLQGNIHVVAVGGGSEGLLTHEGEEVGYVIAGTIELQLGDKLYRIEAGDSFCYRSETPHGYRNIGDCEARVIFINTPPSF